MKRKKRVNDVLVATSFDKGDYTTQFYGDFLKSQYKDPYHWEELGRERWYVNNLRLDEVAEIFGKS